MLKCLLLPLFLIFFSSQSLFAVQCRALFTPLKAHQVGLLNHAASLGEHDYKVLNISVDNRPKTVVLLGEVHQHSKASDLAAQRVLKSFDFYGYENYQINSYFAPKLNAQIYKAFSYFMNKNKFDSTIKKVTNSNLTYLEKVEDYVFSLIKKPNNNINEVAEKKIKNEKGEVTTIVELLGRDHLELLFQTAKANKIKQLKSVDLEYGHKPSIYENIENMGLPAGIFTFLFIASTYSAHTFHPNIVTGIMLDAAIVNAYITGGYYALFSHLQAKNKPLSKVQKFFVGEKNPILYYRDKTMSENIIKAFRENPEQDLMLVIIGRAHMPGLESNLLNNKN